MQFFACSVAASLVTAGVLAAPIPNDPDFALQWGLHNTEQIIAGIAGTPGADIDLLSAWDIHPGGCNVTVAIVGTGVDAHPEFASRLLPGFVSAGAGGDPFSTRDTGPRGTREAGIIAAGANNESGIVGVNPYAKILPVRVTNGTNTTPASVAEGIIWAVDHGADVIAVPLRFAVSSPALETAVAYAAAKDVLCVAPTGNTASLGVAFPAAYDECIAVAPTTNTDGHAPFANFGDEVELAAPGVGIHSTMASGGFGSEEIPGGQSATALAAGVASLIRSYAPQLSAAQVRAILTSSADDLGEKGWDQFFGTGRLNARKALDQTPPPALRFAWETDAPLAILPNRTTTVAITITDEAEALVSNSPELLYSVLPGGKETSLPLIALGNGQYAVSFPALPCGTDLEFYISATGDGGTTISDPPLASARIHTAAAIWTEVIFYDDFESDNGWQSDTLGSPATGAWERVDPVATFRDGTPVQSEYDASANEKSICMVTGQHKNGGAGESDVDGGPVSLLSPTIPLPTGDAEVSYWRWVFSQLGNLDSLAVEMSRDDGNSWFMVEQTFSTNGWRENRFRLSDFPEAIGDRLRLRFVIGDIGNDSLTEAAVDEVRVEAIRCNALPGDIDENGAIDLNDYRILTACISGPDEAVLDSPCLFLDLAGGATIDLRDVAAFMARFSP